MSEAEVETRAGVAGTFWRRLGEGARAGRPLIGSADRTLSYAQAERLVRNACGAFDAHGLTRGDRVVICTPRDDRATCCVLAALMDGMVPVLLDPQTAPPRAAAIVGLAEPRLIVTEDGLLPNGDQPQGGPRLFTTELLADRRDARAPACASDPAALALLIFTSGTTSAPKGVEITHRNLGAMLDTIVRVHGLDTNTRLMNGLSLAHADGLIRGPLLALHCGATLIRPGEFSLQKLEAQLASVREHGVTHFQSVPAILGLIDRYAARDDYFDHPAFQAIFSSASKLEAPLWQRLEARFRRPIVSMYGLTETVADALYAGMGWGTIGTLGIPVDCEVRLVDPLTRRDVSPGLAGEIWLRGDNVSRGYYRNPQMTAERFVDGWLRTGDLARLRPDGSYEMTGRISTMIHSGGYLINPAEIDEALRQHPAVSDSVTVGMADEHVEQIAVSAATIDGDVDRHDLLEHLRGLLESYKVPKAVIVLPELPRGAAGKPQLGEVRELLRDALSGRQPGSAKDGLETVVLQTAAEIMQVEPGSITLDASPETLAGWDSMSHITLVMEVEKRLSVRIPSQAVLEIEDLAGLVAAARAARA